MTSQLFGTAKMILPYEWILEDVEDQPATIASKMILFRGERVFRVGLKNDANSLVLFFVAIDLGKIGMKVLDVKCACRVPGSGPGPAAMFQMAQRDVGDGGSLQLFTVTFIPRKFSPKWTYVFRICLEGTAPGYSYQLADRLAKEQLWAALQNQQDLADVELVVQDLATFPAHKSILAARSQVFAAEFGRKQPPKGGRHRIRIDGVKPSTVENFLYFIYTGEPRGTLADGELLKLAEKYKIIFLSGVCQVAVKEIKATQMTKLMEILHNGTDGLDSSSKITPEKDTEIFFDRTTPTFRCSSQFLGCGNGESKCVMQYQKEDAFFAYFTGHVSSDRRVTTKPVVHFSCAKHRRFGWKVEDIYCCDTQLQGHKKWLKMEEKKFKKNAELLLHSTVQLEHDVAFVVNPYSFDVKIISTIANYCYEMMDNGWLVEFWSAATKQKFTDVEIFVGTVKAMEAHRVILSARSPVLNATLSKISNNAKKSNVTFGPEFDVDIVKDFLNFLYTGSLKTSPRGQQLSKLAAMYEVETLKNVCQLIDVNPPDVEELTDCLLQL